MSEVDFPISRTTDKTSTYCLHVWNSDINNRQFQRRIIATRAQRSELHIIHFVISVVTISVDSAKK